MTSRVTAFAPRPQGVPLPAGPEGGWLLGLMPEFRTRPLQLLERIAREYGDIAYFRLAGQNVYFLNRPDWIQDVLITHDGRFMKSRVLQRAKVMLGEGLLTSEGALHLRQRRMIQPAFYRDRLVAYSRMMTEAAVRTRDRWTEGAGVDMAQEMMRLTLAVVGQTLFSADVEKDAAEVGEALSAVVGLFDLLVLPFSEYLRLLPLPQTRRFERARERLNTLILGMIRERRASGEDRGDLLSMLLMAQDAEAVMSDEQVRDEALTLFLAGHETTAVALTWTWYLLAKHPEIEARMQAEIDQLPADRPPEFDDLPRLRYTEMVLAESMRMYPPAWIIGRIATAGHTVDRYTIPAGSVVILSPYVTHRHPRYYPDAERFDPERFAPGRREERPRFSYFPFGGGPRVCIGERFAWTEGILLLATLARRWRPRLATTEPVVPRPLLTLRPDGGLPMVLERRA